MNIVKKLRHILIFLTIFLLLNTILFIFLFERFAVPVAVRLATQICITRINTAVNESLSEVTKADGITAASLYTLTTGDKGLVTRIDVNSLKVNELCADMAQSLSQRLNKPEPQKIKLPVGALTGMDFLSHINLGLYMPVYITPYGSAEVDYETEVESAGIGQVNLKVWLTVDAEMNLINPLLNKHIHIARKLMLVNTVFAGEVPFT